MWREVRTGAMAITVILVWFSVVTLGHFWRACDRHDVERHWHQRGGSGHVRDLDFSGRLAYWRCAVAGLAGALNVEISGCSHRGDTRALGCQLLYFRPTCYRAARGTLTPA